MPVQAGTAFIDVVPNLAQFDRQLQTQMQQRTRSMARRFQQTGRELSSVGRTLTRRLTLPIAGAGLASLKAAVDFESAFAGVRKTVDATEPEFARLRNGILEMSKQLPAAATEIAAVAEAAGQLGIRTPNILGFTRTMIDLGEATNLSASEAATALARLANITQLPQDQFDRLGSTIVALGNDLATTEAEIVEMGLRIAGAGEQIGLTEAQTLSFAGALSSVGIQAEAGGTAISRVFVDIANASAKGGKKLATFAKVAGLSAAEFRDRFERDAAGALVAFIEGLDKISREGGNVFSVLEELGLSNVRVRDTLLRASNAGDLFRESLALGSKAWIENNALTKEAGERYKTTASQLKIARNQVVAAGIALGDKLAPVAIKAAGAIQGLVEGFDNLSPAAQRMIGIGALVALGLGPGLRIVGGLTSGLGKLAEAFVAARTAGSGLKAIPAFLRGLGINPLGLAIAGVAAGVGFLAVKMATGKTEADRFAEALRRIKAASDSLADAELAERQAVLNKQLTDRRVVDVQRQLAKARREGAPRRELLDLEAALEQARIDQARATNDLTEAEKRSREEEGKQRQARAETLNDVTTRAREVLRQLSDERLFDPLTGKRDPISEASLERVRRLARQYIEAGGSVDHFVEALGKVPADVRSRVTVIANEEAVTVLRTGLADLPRKTLVRVEARAERAKDFEDLTNALNLIKDKDLRARLGVLIQGDDFEAARELLLEIVQPRVVNVELATKAARRAVRDLGVNILGKIPEKVETQLIQRLTGVINGQRTDFRDVEERLNSIKNLDPEIRKEILARLRADLSAAVRVRVPVIDYEAIRGETGFARGRLSLDPRVRTYQTFHQGGLVAGAPGEDVVTLLKPRERVLTENSDTQLRQLLEVVSSLAARQQTDETRPNLLGLRISGTLEFSRSGDAFIRGVIVDELEGENRHGKLVGRMRT